MSIINKVMKLNLEVIDDIGNICTVSSRDIEKVEVVYEEHDGWQEDISDVRLFDDLPENAKLLVRRIEALTRCTVGGFSVGPDREQTIVTNIDLQKYTTL